MLVNTKPLLYLGRDKSTGAYYFLSSKENEGRFLKYLRYPYWCLAAQIGNLLDLTAELPDEVMQEVILFTQGKTRYELVHKKQGRAERIVRHEVQEQKAKEPTPSVASPKQAASTETTAAKAAVPATGTGSTASSAIGEEAGASAKKPRGRPRKLADPSVAGGDPGLQPAAESKPGRRRLAAGSDVLGQPGGGTERRGSPPEPVVAAAEKPKRKRRMSAD